jgi:hypothetical protein
MIPSIRWTRRVALMALAVAALAAGAAAMAVRLPHPASPSRAQAPLAAVLVPLPGRCEIVLIDLAAMRVVRRVPLRSLATDLGVDTASRRFVTAQAGGVGTDADDVLGVLDPRFGDVRYVRLAQANPGSVACIGGRAYVLHGLSAGDRMFVSVVDIADERLERSGTAPNTSGLWDQAGGYLWTLAVSTEGSANALVRLDPSDLATVTAVPAHGFAGSVVGGGASLFVLYGARAGAALEATTGSIAEIDPTTGSVVRAVVVRGLLHGASRGVVAGSKLALIDWNGEEPESGTVALLDRATLDVTAMVQTGGAPCALAEWDDRVLVVDRSGGKLMLIDTANGRVSGSVDLGVRDLVFSDVAVLGEGRTGVRTAEAISGP